METKLGDDAEEATQGARQARHPRSGREASPRYRPAAKGRFTVFALVDALTRIAGELANAGDRTDADERAGALLALAK